MSDSPTALTPKFPYFIDSTILAGIKSCPFQTALSYLCNLRPRGTGHHLFVGGTLAHALEVTRKAFYGPDKATPEEAVLAGQREIFRRWGDTETPFGLEHKSFERVVDAFQIYFTQFPLGEEPMTPMILSDGKPAIEYTFAIPLEELPHPDTGDPLVYVGRFDQLGEYRNARLIHDDKTTSQLGATWSEKWHLRGQFLGYKWACDQGGLPVNGYSVRGICFYKHYTQITPLITGFFTQQMIDNWYHSMIISVRQFIEQYRTGFYVRAFNDTCTAYSGCQFGQICKSADPEAWLEQYEHHEWDPLADSNSD